MTTLSFVSTQLISGLILNDFLSKNNVHKISYFTGIFAKFSSKISLYNVVQYRGGYHDACEGYLEYRGGVQYHGGIMSTVGGHLSTVGDIMMHVGDINMHVEDMMITVGVFSTMRDTILCNLSTVGDIMEVLK